MECQSLELALDRLQRPKLLILGDLILDRYTWGNAARVSPEAPVLVLAADTQENRPGGAASVAALARGLEADVAVAGIVGTDGDGQELRRLLEEAGIDVRLLLADPNRPTTVKERVIGRAAGRHPHQIVRVDREVVCSLRPGLERALAEAVIDTLDDFEALLVSDYQKGVCTDGLLRTLIQATRKRGVPVLVDPARIENYRRYQGATLLVPNRAEAGLATGSPITTPDDGLRAARRLRAECEADAVVVKLDTDGMVLVDTEGHEEHLPARFRQVYDVTGAGDMVLDHEMPTDVLLPKGFFGPTAVTREWWSDMSQSAWKRGAWGDILDTLELIPASSRRAQPVEHARGRGGYAAVCQFRFCSNSRCGCNRLTSAAQYESI